MSDKQRITRKERKKEGGKGKMREIKREINKETEIKKEKGIKTIEINRGLLEVQIIAQMQFKQKF